MLFANTRKKVFSRRGPNLVVSYIIVQGLGICDQSCVRLFVSLLKEKGVPTPYRLPHPTPKKSKVAIGCLRNTGTSPLARGRSLKPSVKYVMTGKKHMSGSAPLLPPFPTELSGLAHIASCSSKSFEYF